MQTWTLCEHCQHCKQHSQGLSSVHINIQHKHNVSEGNCFRNFVFVSKVTICAYDKNLFVYWGVCPLRLWNVLTQMGDRELNGKGMGSYCTYWQLMLCTAQTGTICCAPHRLAPYAVQHIDSHLMLCTAQTDTLWCAPHRLAPYAVHRTDWLALILMCRDISGYCEGGIRAFRQPFQWMLQQTSNQLLPSRSRCLNIELRNMAERGWINK